MDQQRERTENDRDQETQRVAGALADRLRTRGVHVFGTESANQLATILESVEAFELAVESQGGDLMVDEGPKGMTTEPDDPHFVLPTRAPGESVAASLGRLDEATKQIRRHRPHKS